ncbi:MAG: helix-turn-helix domain-containing protein [Candidatus Nezhaarchaeota archaeon]|nr:helix-turn-helix domain-containing protein [Candidatus Nezhaarchaeota archaeon]MCX8142487.1 helix-turn-helix domain-containing protein [Candidatus Nezhaarchaeota archaeon]MDW8050540.1 helix-turn-helix domain-containing protein [Nitrososphaerota archaeon]
MLEGLKPLKLKTLTSRVSIEDVMECLLGLNRDEIRAYFTILEKPMTVEELAEALRKSKPTAYRIAIKLTNMGLLVRKPHIIERGGYYYKYEAIEPERLKRSIQEVLNSICKRVLEALNQDFTEVRKRLQSSES